ncbi:TetR/AcrR family transcriptional regulator [Pseudonocardia kujensis]|uniref:TetR/AcrR family transcriptional regulator n=1 Tax=Pseudonocardia kujensis TaxID=1128675 RepID=UPI001E28543D|nr:TetR/AcrR family transcriptional regulator [Pseudonocardia kujensis]MCE0764996.1 TetR/AcrR family transcriptional regulator [Pseudonocardia kujensis]
MIEVESTGLTPAGGTRSTGGNGRRRVRMEAAARRDQLLEAGVVLFAERGYDEVEIADIAAAAGVSRGLLYHYFPDKVAFFLAVMARQLDALARATRVAPAAPDSPPGTREATVRAGLDAYFDFVAAHPQWYRSIYRSAVSAHSAARELVERAHARQARRILALFGELDPDPLQRVAVRGWVSFLATVGMSWLDGSEVPREQLRERCLQVLFSSLGVTPARASSVWSGSGSSHE